MIFSDGSGVMSLWCCLLMFQFCKMMMSTQEEAMKMAKKRLEKHETRSKGLKKTDASPKAKPRATSKFAVHFDIHGVLLVL